MKAILAMSLLLLAIDASAAEIITDCSIERGRDGAHWAYREISGKKCWYRGETGRPKNLLRWTQPLKHPSGVGEDRPEVGHTITAPSDLGADSIAPTAIATEEIAPWQATSEDQTQAFTCCWPELKPISMPLPTIVKELPRATPPVQPIWPIIFLPAIVLAVTFLFVQRRIS